MRRAGTWLLGLALLAHAMVAVGAEELPAPAGAAQPDAPVVLVKIEGAIGPATADHLHRALAMAAKLKAPLAVLQMDTPGGLDASMRSIIRDILASPVPVASYVAPNGARAASAGTYILYASHVAAMAPASNLGAATPVAIGLPAPGGQPDATGAPDARPASAAGQGTPAGEHTADAMTAKRVGDAAAYIRSLAQLRGRNAAWAEKAVREAVSLSSQEALKSNVIDLIARDVPDLLQQVNGREIVLARGTLRLATASAQVVEFEADWRTRFLSVITDPSLALILMLVGIYGLLFEFSNPGFVLPGVVGGICLLLALFALQMLPVNYAGLALLLLGVAFLIAEAFLPTFGALGVGGIVAFAFGAVLLFDGEVPGFGIPKSLIALLSATSAAFILVVAGMAAKARKRPVVNMVDGSPALLGATGQLIEFSNGEGWAMIRGEHWRVNGANDLRPGEQVRVTRARSQSLEVAADGTGLTTGVSSS
jgi:membrane-bound serine protease (ClpP class)